MRTDMMKNIKTLVFSDLELTKLKNTERHRINGEPKDSKKDLTNKSSKEYDVLPQMFDFSQIKCKKKNIHLKKIKNTLIGRGGQRDKGYECGTE